MALDNLASGLIGAVVGAIVGAALTVVGLWFDRRDRRTAHARAVWTEAVYNAALLEQLLQDSGPASWPSNAAFLAGLSDIAALMKFDELRAVTAPYQALAGMPPLRSVDDGNRERVAALQKGFSNAEVTLGKYIQRGRF